VSRQIKHSYEFGPFHIDTVNRVLLCSGEPVPLKAKAVDTLLLLVQHNGEVVEKDELMKQLWPDSFVEEANLTQNIYVLRKALGEGRYIETVPRRGYRFAADVKEGDDTSELIVIKEKTSTSLSYEEEFEQESSEFGPDPARNGSERVIDVALERAGRQSPKIESSTLSLDRRRLWLALVLSAGAIAIGALVFWPRTAKAPFENVKLTRFTTTGTALKAAISPDGKYLAHTAIESGLQSVWLRQVATGKDLSIVAPQPTEVYGLTFSHDGNYIYYVSQETNRLGMLFQVPTLGGTPNKLIEDVDSPVTLSPDDQRLAFLRFSPGHQNIIIANFDGTGEQRLATSNEATSFRIGPNWIIPPAWSPDGKIIACAVSIAGSEGEYQSIWGFQVVDGTTQALSSARWVALGRMEWLSDGKGLLITAAEQEANPAQQIWFVPYPQGPERKITNDLSDYRDLSVSANASTLIAIQIERKANIWIASTADINSGRQLTFTNYDGSYGLSWTPDDKLVYTFEAGGEQNLWLTDLDKNPPQQLTSHAGFNQQPIVSPDGRYIVFVSNRSGRQHLWRIDIDGKHPLELTHGLEDNEPSFAPDGQSVVFKSRLVSGGSRIFRVAINDGEPVRLIDKISAAPTVSPDGKLIAFYYRAEPASINKIAVMPIAGGEPRLIRDLPAHYGRLCWANDSRALTYVPKQQGTGNIWLQPLDGSPPKQLTNWKADPIPAFEWSRDGKWLAYAVGAQTSDVVLIRDVRR
jgi:Tol biopolymer transport system component/DNA-binding winged helix-turn-helix (wHTH) protein